MKSEQVGSDRETSRFLAHLPTPHPEGLPFDLAAESATPVGTPRPSKDEAVADTRRRALGCLLGGAVGDALGEPVEFMSLHEIRQILGPEGVTGFWDRAAHPGGVSDDTQMTLWTAEALIRTRQRWVGSEGGWWSPINTTVNAYMRWLLTQGEAYRGGHQSYDDDLVRTGWLFEERGLWKRRGPGNTCLSALRMLGATEPGVPVNDSKGCGGVMRIAPVGFIDAHDEAYPYELGKSLAKITHGHPTGYIAAGVFAQVVDGLRRGLDLEPAIDEAVALAEPDPDSGETVRAVGRARELATRGADSAKVESLGGGWVAEEALAIALYCALTADDFRSGVLRAVNHSGDSDSTGSMTGQILGASHGVEAIPREWLDRVELGKVTERIANDLVDAFFEDRVFPADLYPAF